MSENTVIRIFEYQKMDRAELTKPRGSHTDVSVTVREILDAVKTDGDEALFRFTERFDHVKLSSLKVSEEEWEEGLSLVDSVFLDILEQAACNIRRYHEQ